MRTRRTTRTILCLFGVVLLPALPGCVVHALVANFPQTPAGADHIRVGIRRYYQARVLPDLTHGWQPVGEVRISIPSLRAEFEDDPDPAAPTRELDDGFGGRLIFRRNDRSNECLYRVDPHGAEELIAEIPHATFVDEPRVALGGGDVYVFGLRGWPDDQDKVVRVQVGARRVDLMDLPPDEEINDPDSPSYWEGLFAAGPDEVVLVGRARHSSRIGPMMHRTWIGDFSTGKWTGPIDGAYRPLDSTGALVEVRRINDGAYRREKDANKLWWIDDEGGKHVVDLGHAVEVVPVFGTRYVMSWDPWRNEVVLQSLTGEPEKRIRVPDSWE